MARAIVTWVVYVPTTDIHRCRVLFLRNAMACRDGALALSIPQPGVRQPSVNYETIKQSFITDNVYIRSPNEKQVDKTDWI